MKNNLYLNIAILFTLILLNSIANGQTDSLFFDGQSLGNIDNVNDQASGIVWITDNQDVWTHNDYWQNAPLNQKNKIFKLDLSNTGPGNPIGILKTITINEPGVNTTNIDWEDITKDNNNNVYIGNFGDNNGGFNRILKIGNPNNLGTSVTPDVIYYEYPKVNGNEVVSNTEAMFYFQGSLYLFSKIIRGDAASYQAQGYTYLFKIPATLNTQANPHLAANLGNFKTDIVNSNNDLLWRVTGAAISPDEKTVALLCQSRLWLFSCFSGDDFFGGKSRYADFYKNGALFTSQKEGISFADNETLYISEDGGSTRFIQISITDLLNLCGSEPNTCSLIENGSFENNSSNWQFYESSTATANWNTSNETANINIIDGSIGKWKVQLFQSGLNFEQSKTYEISFKAKAVAAKGIYAKLSTYDDSVDYQYHEFDVNTNWQNYTFYSTMNAADDNNARLSFGLGENNINLSIDDVLIQEYTCNNTCVELIRNGDFLNNKDEYNLFIANDAEATWYQNSSGEYVSIKIVDGADKKWKVQMTQTDIPLQQNKNYRLQFRAKADSTKPIYVKMSDNSDLISYMLTNYLDITDTWQEYEFTFTMNEADDNNARLNFAIGQNEIAVRFDDISLTETSCNRSACLPNLVHFGSIQNGTYQVNDYIQSTGILNTQSGNVQYKANNRISLHNGFSADAGFSASVDGCE